MKYDNKEMKIDQIIGYFNDKKINLVPPFQRGSVWKLPQRQKLIENIVSEKPIPAIFLYKKEAGSQFSYNILDGKQRLETLILFIGNRRDDLKVENINQYFIGKPETYRDANFPFLLDGKLHTCAQLEDRFIRKLREYAIATIEIDLDEDRASLDEIVDLFIDINQQGVKVSRFDVVKALVKDKLFRQAFRLIAKRKDRKKSTYFTPLDNSFTRVMSKLTALSRITDKNSRVDRMWERFTEIALFSRDSAHRAPADILKSFINMDENKNINKSLDESELAKLRTCFGFLDSAYHSNPRLAQTKLATDQPQFYTLITTLLSTDLIDEYPQAQLVKRIYRFAQMVEGTIDIPRNLQKSVQAYKVAATKQTTNPNRRSERHVAFVKTIEGMDS